jgi:hypothetical protein
MLLHLFNVAQIVASPVFASGDGVFWRRVWCSSGRLPLILTACRCILWLSQGGEVSRCDCLGYGMSRCDCLEYGMSRCDCLGYGMSRCDCLGYGMSRCDCLGYSMSRCDCLGYGKSLCDCLGYGMSRCDCLRHGAMQSVHIYWHFGGAKCLHVYLRYCTLLAIYKKMEFRSLQWTPHAVLINTTLSLHMDIILFGNSHCFTHTVSHRPLFTLPCVRVHSFQFSMFQLCCSCILRVHRRR